MAEDPPIPRLPEHPLADLRELHTAIKELLVQLRHKLYAATDFSTERQFSALNTSVYTQACPGSQATPPAAHLHMQCA